MLVSMVEDEEPIPILKPIRIVEFILSLACLVFFAAYISMAHNGFGNNLTGFLYATFTAFLVICLVDIVSQVAGEPVPSTPMFLFCLFAVGMFLSSGVIGINFYNSEQDYSWCLLVSAVLSLIATIFFTMDAAMLCREKRHHHHHHHHYHRKRPFIQCPSWKSHWQSSQEPQEDHPISDVPQQWQGEERIQYTHIYPDKPRKSHRTQQGLPTLAFYAGKHKDEMVQTSVSDGKQHQQFEVPASLYIPAQQSRDDTVLVDDKRVLYREVSQGHVLQIVNSINVRRLSGAQLGAQKGSDTSPSETTPMIEAVPTSDCVKTVCKDKCTQFPEERSSEDRRKKPICCCGGEPVNPSPPNSKDHHVRQRGTKQTHSSVKRADIPANRGRNQEVQVDPYQLGMRVVPIQQNNKEPNEVMTPCRKHMVTPATVTPVSVTSRCDVDMYDLLPGSVPETYKK